MPPPKATEAHISIIIIIRWRALQRAQPSQHVDAILDNPVSAHTRLSSSPGRVVGGQFDGTDRSFQVDLGGLLGPSRLTSVAS